MGGGGNQQQTPWAVLLCKVNDDQSETPVPNFRTVCERFFTTPGAGFNAVQFFSDMSHGSVNLSGSQVFGWFTLDVTTEYAKRLGQDIQNHVMTLAKQAARGVLDQNVFFGVVLIMNVTTGWAQGFYNTAGGNPGPGVWADWRRVDGRMPDGSLGPRSPGGGNGTEVFGQEMGHGYGLGHSRRDGSDDDYQDCWDIMSTDNNCSAPDPEYCARGPGLNAWNMRGRGWLDESRVWHGPGTTFSEIVELHPLHLRDLFGWLAAELPPNDGVGGHGRYLVEFRIKEAWDAGIPRSAVFVHRYLDPAPQNDGYPGRSYIMSGTQGNQDLVEGDVFASKDGASRAEVLKINENDQTATVRLTCVPAVTLVGKTHIEVFEAEMQDDPEVQQDYSVQGISGASRITWTGSPGVQFIPPSPNTQNILALFDMTGHTDAGSSRVFTINVSVVGSFGLVISDQISVAILVKPNK